MDNKTLCVDHKNDEPALIEKIGQEKLIGLKILFQLHGIYLIPCVHYMSLRM